MEPTYAARWIYLFPRWYTLYSILPGSREVACEKPSILEARGPARVTTIASCLGNPGPSLSNTAPVVDEAADAVEDAFRGRVRITRLVVRLVPPGSNVFERDSTLLRPRHLTIELVASFQPGNEEASHRRLVRSLAHELFHMGKRALEPWHDPLNSKPPEEVAAALFESCVEIGVFGSLSPGATSPTLQADPIRLSASADAYRSAAGNLEATNWLRQIAGVDGTISGDPERKKLESLCKSLTP